MISQSKISTLINHFKLFIWFLSMFAGIMFAQFFTFGIESLLIFLLGYSFLLALLQILNILKKQRLLLVFSLLFFLAGIIMFKPFYELDEGKCTITGQINKVTASSIRLTDVSFLKEGSWYKARGEFYCFLPDHDLVEELDYIGLTGTNGKMGNLNFIRVFMASDYFAYPYSKNILTGINKHLNRYAEKFVSFVKEATGDKNGSYASGMFLGLGMDKETKTIINDSGISYLFVVSGFHFFLTFFIFSYFLSFLKTNPKLTIIFKMLFLILFYMICATGPSSFRAFLMLFLYQLFKLFDYPVSSFNVIGLSGLIILFIDPSIALNAGFQMTFGAVLGILLLNHSLKGKKEFFRNFAALGSLLFITPITAYHFKTIPLLSVPVGFILSLTIIPLIMICMMLSLFFYAIQLHFLAAVLLKGLTPLLELSRMITEFLAGNFGSIGVDGVVRIVIIALFSILSIVLFTFQLISYSRENNSQTQPPVF